ncbi:hypothetical protein KBX71_02300 [Micromonospora sp. D93]|uniref:hypothetical protein n=1 Tax=Micromonospora sp. D93 TaxID=2824886 RepID=UPI001B35B32E|nr:hypothetical protein [Micromonospora sp. D93]MBQ1016691.1 hypothetical protein [Micromonospora sp. D93]
MLGQQYIEIAEKATRPTGCCTSRPGPSPVTDADDIEPAERRDGWLDVLALADDSPTAASERSPAGTPAPTCPTATRSARRKYRQHLGVGSLG